MSLWRRWKPNLVVRKKSKAKITPQVVIGNAEDGTNLQDVETATRVASPSTSGVVIDGDRVPQDGSPQAEDQEDHAQWMNKFITFYSGES